MPKHPEAKLLIAYHDELTAQFPEDQAEKVARFVEEVMLAEMDEVVNTALGANQPDWVPVEVDVEILGKWDGE